MAEAGAEGDLPLPARRVVLAQVRQEGREGRVEIDPARPRVGEDALGGEERLGEGGEVEQRVAGRRDRCRHLDRAAAHRDLSPTAAGDAEDRAGDVPRGDGGLGKRPGGVEAHVQGPETPSAHHAASSSSSNGKRDSSSVPVSVTSSCCSSFTPSWPPSSPM